MDERQPIPRRRDDVKKTKKLVSLNPDAVEKIKAYSVENNVSFSAAIECLALIGLEDDIAHTVVPIIVSALHKSVNSSFNRIAKISAFGAIEAATSREMTGAVLKQVLISQHARHGDELEDSMRISKRHPAKLLRDKITGIARYRAYKRLKSPLDQVEEILNAQELDINE